MYYRLQITSKKTECILSYLYVEPETMNHGVTAGLYVSICKDTS